MASFINRLIKLMELRRSQRALVLVLLLSLGATLLLFLSLRKQLARPVPDFNTFHRLALKDAMKKRAYSFGEVRRPQPPVRVKHPPKGHLKTDKKMVLSVMGRLEMIFLALSVMLLVMTLLPQLFEGKDFANVLWPGNHRRPMSYKHLMMRNFTNAKDNSNEQRPYNILGVLILNGVRQPHSAKRSEHWRRVNAFQKLMRQRPWPQFSPGPQHFKTMESEPSTSETLPPIGSWSNTSSTSDANDKPRLVKELYVEGHAWSHPKLCKTKTGDDMDADVQLLVMVASHPRNEDLRSAIRLTWGHYAASGDIVLAFMLGQPASAHLIDQLVMEDTVHKDMIVSNMRASPRNATLNALSLLEWVQTHCAHARAVLKTDDDVFINVPQLMDFVRTRVTVHNNNTIWGKVIKGIKPERRHRYHPYYVTGREFPSSVLPAHMSGAAYMLTPSVARALLRSAPARPYLRLEDVFVTGVLARNASVRLQHVDSFFKFNRTLVRTLKPCAVRLGIAFNKVHYDEMFQLWHRMHNTTLRCENTTKVKKLKRWRRKPYKKIGKMF